MTWNSDLISSRKLRRARDRRVDVQGGGEDRVLREAAGEREDAGERERAGRLEEREGVGIGRDGHEHRAVPGAVGRGERRGLGRRHQPAVTDDVGGENCRQSAGVASFGAWAVRAQVYYTAT